MTGDLRPPTVDRATFPDSPKARSPTEGAVQDGGRERARVRDDGRRHYAERTCVRAAGACASERAQCNSDRDAVLTRSRTLMNSLQRPQEIKSKNQKAICRRPLLQPDDSCGVDAEYAATGAAGTASDWTRRS
ncbi:hypothetical protein NP493_208g03020 [Ridgeia piscesae]|uniref:Uncharacterized protein n=1 Tax=Ridgeia piscesae TaxID=27915 RepID=A0AAD9P1K8_RIDPI|nr:hypothetical protein NP493_208g03020 [Ridgeia piscesae]